MRSYTLDTNCLIDLEENRPAAESLRQLVAAFRRGEITLAIPAIMASENQPGGQRIDNFGQFQQRLDRSGLGDVEQLLPMLYLDVCFIDHCLFSDEEGLALERRIHDAVHPEVEFAAANASSLKKWRNAKCDVQAMWSHIQKRRECFVTSDTDFLNNVSALVALGAGAIKTPEDAATLLKVASRS